MIIIVLYWYFFYFLPIVYNTAWHLRTRFIIIHFANLSFFIILDFWNFKTQYRHYYTTSEYYFIEMAFHNGNSIQNIHQLCYLFSFKQQSTSNKDTVIVTLAIATTRSMPWITILNRNARMAFSLPAILNRSFRHTQQIQLGFFGTMEEEEST